MSGTQDLDEPLPLVEPWGKLLSLNNFKVKSQDLILKEVNLFSLSRLLLAEMSQIPLWFKIIDYQEIIAN